MSSSAIGSEVTSIKNSAMAPGSFALSGKQSSLVFNEAADQFGMSDDAKIVGSDNVELGGTSVKNTGDYLGGAAVKLGENSTYTQTVMDEATRQILDQAMTIVGQNANNMMTLAAGRDADKPLADGSLETDILGDNVEKTLDGIAGVVSPARIGAAAAVLALIVFLWLKRGRKRK